MKEKIISSLFASVLLVSSLNDSESKCLSDRTRKENIETIVSEYVPENYLLPENITESYLFCDEDFIYSIIDKIISKKKREIPKYLDREFFRWVSFIESEDNPWAVSHKGARGLMQLTIDSWNQVGKKSNYFDNVYNPEKNIEGGINYFIWLDKYCSSKHPDWSSLSDDKKADILLASYNGGITRLFNLDWNISKMPSETKLYVEKMAKNKTTNS